MNDSNLLSQEEINNLMNIDTFISDEPEQQSLMDEIRQAILDSGKLSLMEWKKLRNKLKEVEELIPHIDLIIRLKESGPGK